jgi:hypothetical protein
MSLEITSMMSIEGQGATVTAKKIVTRLLLIFVFLSAIFLGYKELVSVGQEKKIRDAGINARDSGNREYAGVKTSQENVSKSKKDATPLPAATVQLPKSKVVAYYFHGTFRCATCRTIENYSKEAIEHYFIKELKNGTLEFKAINVEDPGNHHYIQDYRLFSKALIIILYKDDKQVKWKNLKEVWIYAGDKDKFLRYVKDEVEGFLKEAQ